MSAKGTVTELPSNVVTEFLGLKVIVVTALGHSRLKRSWGVI